LTGKSTFHEVMIDYQRRYGDKFMFWFGSHPCPVFCLPEHAQTIFSDRHTFEQSPLLLPNFDLLCPHSIFVLKGPKWKRHIRVMLPMFKRAKIIHYLDAIIECTDRFIDGHLSDNHIHGDLKVHCQSLLMNIIGFIGFNYDLESVMNSSLKKALEDFAFQASLIMMIPSIPRWLIKLYFKLNWRYQRSQQLLRELTEKIVEQEQNNQNTMENERPKNLIASFISSLNEHANDEQVSSGLTRAEIFDEILASILAGYETTSTALSWFIFYMSKHPRIQQRIKEELAQHNLLMTDDISCLPSLTQDKLDALIYCECVTKEVH
jgi:cytochrome P450